MRLHLFLEPRTLDNLTERGKMKSVEHAACQGKPSWGRPDSMFAYFAGSNPKREVGTKRDRHPSENVSAPRVTESSCSAPLSFCVHRPTCQTCAWNSSKMVWLVGLTTTFQVEKWAFMPRISCGFHAAHEVPTSADDLNEVGVFRD